MMNQIAVHSERITLAAFLKFSGAAESGGHAKALILSGSVLVDGQPCLQRGKKLSGGEVVSLNGQKYEVVTNALTIARTNALSKH